MSFLTEPISISSFFGGRKRSIADISGYITLKEDTTDRIVITKQPVQKGAPITDHAYKEPTDFSCSLIFSNNIDSVQSLDEIYADLLELQESFEPIKISTPKRVYNNMLISNIGQTTDKNTENNLSIFFNFQQVIIVNIGNVTVPKTSQGQPGTTQATQDVGKKSVAKRIFNGITGQ